MYNKWRSSKDFKCRGFNLPHHYLTSGRLSDLRYISYHLNFLGHSFRFILMFFNWCRVSIRHRSVNHSRTSSTTRREVVAATPTTQTKTVLLDWFRQKINFVIGCCVVNFVIGCCVLLLVGITVIFVCYVKNCVWSDVVFNFFKKIFNFCRPTIADGSY
jgi:hypothetical protein